MPWRGEAPGWRLWSMVALVLALIGPGHGAAAEVPPELRPTIIAAGMAPWNGGRISLDEALRGPDREAVSLRQFVGKPILTYNYAVW